jgi:hypothetical protein
MHAAGKPGIDLPEPRRLCDDAPGLEVSLGKLLEHGFIKLSICKEALKARVLQLKLLEAFGLCGFHSPVQMLPG